MDFEKGTKGRHMGTDLGVGAKAPAFKLPRDDGSSVALKDFKGRSLVRYFYPKADTSGCTREAIDFTKTTVRIPEGRSGRSAGLRRSGLRRRTSSRNSTT